MTTPSSPMPEARSRFWLGWGLVAYGVLGLAVVLVGALVAVAGAQRLERTLAAVDGTLEAAADSTRAVADSFDSIDDGLAGAEVATSGAAELARDASATLDGLASAMNISILGAQPLAPLADDFERVAEQSADVADSLDAVGASLSDVRTDADVIADELSGLADELDELRTAADTSAPVSLIPFMILLLAWITVPAIGALVVGANLLRNGTIFRG